MTITDTLGIKNTVTSDKTKIITISGEETDPVAKTLSSIKVTTSPSKVKYTEGESFDTTGMVITASYSDGTSKEITEYTYTPNGELKETDTKVTITYTEGNVTKEVEQAITVTKKSNTNNNEVPNGGTTNTSNATKNDATVSNKVLSQTGISNYLVYSIIIITVIGIVSFIKYKRTY